MADVKKNGLPAIPAKQAQLLINHLLSTDSFHRGLAGSAVRVGEAKEHLLRLNRKMDGCTTRPNFLLTTGHFGYIPSMSKFKRRFLAMVSLLLAPIPGWGQSLLNGTLTMGLGDVAEIKQKAEAGDPNAQTALGDTLASQFHATEALEWYRKAAQQGNVAAKYHVGDMLLFGAPGIPSSLAVHPNPSEGVRWSFAAATNFHPHACWNMGKALRSGLGTRTNLIEAYTWLSLYSETTDGSIVGRVEMNQLALKLDTASIRQAQALAAQFKAGIFVTPVSRAIPEGDSQLKLNGITFGNATPLAIINGKTMSQGESAVLPFKPAALKIRCQKIEKESVLILVEGEDQPRLLRLK